ncbi:hypothetical protein [Alkalicoccus urumqiensis]|nr:hypothetical protein [Alkalicoccus urumqiensis]
MKGRQALRKKKKKLLWRDLLKRKLGEVNGLPKKEEPTPPRAAS